MTTSQPNLRFLLAHPAHFIALGFGAGLAPKAPGTFGTLVAFPLFLALPNAYLQPAIICFFISGIMCCEIAGRNLGVSDHGSIVWDEIVAMLLVLYFTPFHVYAWLLAFALFRLFDIWKPFPIRQADAKIKGGLGVMLDDILAAVYAILAMKGMLWLAQITMK